MHPQIRPGPRPVLDAHERVCDALLFSARKNTPNLPFANGRRTRNGRFLQKGFASFLPPVRPAKRADSPPRHLSIALSEPTCPCIPIPTGLALTRCNLWLACAWARGEATVCMHGREVRTKRSNSNREELLSSCSRELSRSSTLREALATSQSHRTPWQSCPSRVAPGSRPCHRQSCF